jgi:Family of unknown function (DUF5683)
MSNTSPSVLRPLAFVATLIAALALAAPARAQVTPADTARPAPADTVVRAAPADTARPPAARDSVVRRRVSPRDAFLRSLVLPGWGQSSVGAPGRGAIYFALEVGSLWMVYKSDQKLDEARRQEAVLVETGQLEEGVRSPLVRDRRNQKEDWITLSVFWLFFSGADAFVAAHLRDFDEHVGVEPGPEGGFQIRGSIPVGP